MKLSKSRKSPEHQFLRLVQIMAKLRSPKGCPWDKQQNHRSLLPYLFSEAAELKHALKTQNWENVKEELGDLLLQIVFHSRIAQENGHFSISDVISEINNKLIRRHPHVFSTEKLYTARQVRQRWEKIKRKEKTGRL